jgi:hypothetical protein
MLYEVREYTAVPGKLPALIRRFKDHTLGLFEKHGMDVVFMSLTEFGENSSNELVYVMRFDSYAEMQEKWSTFVVKPDWVAIKQESEVDGPLVAQVRRRLLNTAAFDSA